MVPSYVRSETTANEALAAVILVVEDSPTVRKLVTQTLTVQGYEVYSVEDGVEALEFLSHTVPDLIISDIHMPRLDGLELLTRLREDPRTAEITIILLTAMNEPDDIVRGLELGADDYLVKPFNLPELHARISARLKRPPVDAEQLTQDRRTGVLKTSAFLGELEPRIDPHPPAEREKLRGLHRLLRDDRAGRAGRSSGPANRRPVD